MEEAEATNCVPTFGGALQSPRRATWVRQLECSAHQGSTRPKKTLLRSLRKSTRKSLKELPALRTRHPRRHFHAVLSERSQVGPEEYQEGARGGQHRTRLQPHPLLLQEFNRRTHRHCAPTSEICVDNCRGQTMPIYGAPLVTLKKEDDGVRPIVVGDTLSA